MSWPGIGHVVTTNLIRFPLDLTRIGQVSQRNYLSWHHDVHTHSHVLSLEGSNRNDIAMILTLWDLTPHVMRPSTPWCLWLRDTILIPYSFKYSSPLHLEAKGTPKVYENISFMTMDAPNMTTHFVGQKGKKMRFKVECMLLIYTNFHI